MHELGVVFHIIDDLKEVAIQNDIEKITKVVLELGEVSTVIDRSCRRISYRLLEVGN